MLRPVRAERSNLHHVTRFSMGIAAHALALDPRVASLLAMTGDPPFTQLPYQLSATTFAIVPAAM